MIDVFFEDASKKKFVISDDTTVKELTQKIVQKMQIVVDIESFALFEQTEENGVKIDKFLKPDDICPKLIGPSHFLFKKRFFFEENTDPVAVHMEYIQVREEVLRGHYVLSEREFLELASIDLRVCYGNPDSSKHKIGFLTSSNLIPRFIPQSAIKLKKLPQWEKLLLDEFQRIAFDPIETDFDGKQRYLARLREWQPDYFGSIFYDAKELRVEDKVVREKIPVVLAINKVGIHTFRKGLKGAPNTAMRTNTFQEILGWAVHPPTHTFIYNVAADTEEGQRFTYETDLAGEIPEVCQSYVQMIIQATAGSGEEAAPASAVETDAAAAAEGEAAPAEK